MPMNKAEDAGGLAPAKDENAVHEHFDRRAHGSLGSHYRQGGEAS